MINNLNENDFEAPRLQRTEVLILFTSQMSVEDLSVKIRLLTGVNTVNQDIETHTNKFGKKGIVFEVSFEAKTSDAYANSQGLKNALLQIDGVELVKIRRVDLDEYEKQQLSAQYTPTIKEAYVAIEKDNEYEPHEYNVLNRIADKLQGWMEDNKDKKEDGKNLVLDVEEDPEMLADMQQAGSLISKFTYEDAFRSLSQTFDSAKMGSIYNIVANYLDMKDKKTGLPYFDPNKISENPNSILNLPYSMLSRRQATRKRELKKILSTLFFLGKSDLKDQLFFVKNIGGPVQAPYLSTKEKAEEFAGAFLGSEDPAQKMGAVGSSGASAQQFGNFQVRFSPSKQSTGPAAERKLSCASDINTSEMFKRFSNQYTVIYVPRKLNEILELSGGDIGTGEFLLYLMMDPSTKAEFQPKIHESEEERGDQASQAFYDIKINNKYWHIKDLRAADRSVDYGVRVSEKTKDLAASDPITKVLLPVFNNNLTALTRSNFTNYDNVVHIISALLGSSHNLGFEEFKTEQFENPVDYFSLLSGVAKRFEARLNQTTRDSLYMDKGHNVGGLVAIIGGGRQNLRISSFVFVPVENLYFYRFSTKGIHVSITPNNIASCISYNLHIALNHIQKEYDRLVAAKDLSVYPSEADIQADPKILTRSITLRELAQNIYSRAIVNNTGLVGDDSGSSGKDMWWFILALINGFPLDPDYSIEIGKDAPLLKGQKDIRRILYFGNIYQVSPANVKFSSKKQATDKLDVGDEEDMVTGDTEIEDQEPEEEDGTTAPPKSSKTV